MAVGADEAVLITADTATDMQALDAVFNAVDAARARPVSAIIPQLPFQGGLADPYVSRTLHAAAQNCDVWLDLTWPYLAGSHAHDEAMKLKRVRYVLLGDLGSGGLVRMFANLDLDGYFNLLAEFDLAVGGAAIGKRARLTNALGTDVSFTLTKPGLNKPRRCTEPGMYVVPGGGSIYPELESVKGKIVVGATFHEYYKILDQSMTFHIDGKIRHVEGGGADRQIMDRSLRRAAGGDYGYIIHLTHGLHPAARFTGNSFIEDSRVLGNNAVGLGLPWWVPGGGENHPDAILALQSLWVEDQQIAADGVLIGPPKLAKMAHDLIPLYGRSQA
jgi:2,5-dihydroxypyridine 5,6-dioxygenase